MYSLFLYPCTFLHQLELRWFAQPLLYSRRDQEKVAPFVVAYRSKGTKVNQKKCRIVLRSHKPLEFIRTLWQQPRLPVDRSNFQRNPQIAATCHLRRQVRGKVSLRQSMVPMLCFASWPGSHCGHVQANLCKSLCCSPLPQRA